MLKIKDFRLTALVSGLITTFVAPAILAATPLLPLDAGDLQAQKPAKAPAMTLANTSRDTVSFAWPADHASALLKSEPFVAISRSYRVAVSGADLNKGVPLATTAPGALVRLHPSTDPQLTMPTLDELEVVTATRTLEGREAMDALGDAQAMRGTVLGANPGTIAFRLSRSAGTGAVTLRANKALPADGRYMVNVFDRNSAVSLRAAADRDAYFSGDTVRVTVAFDGAAAAGALDAFVLAPDGSRHDARVDATGDGRFTVSARADRATAPGELWEIHASGNATSDGVAIPRAVKTAFAVTHASARFGGTAEIERGQGLRISLPVEAAADGRYEARAMLFGTDKKGALRAIANVATARWIATGTATIDLVIEPAMIAGSGLGAPYEIRDLRLVDQSRMSTLHRQARALQFN